MRVSTLYNKIAEYIAAVQSKDLMTDMYYKKINELNNKLVDYAYIKGKLEAYETINGATNEDTQFILFNGKLFRICDVSYAKSNDTIPSLTVTAYEVLKSRKKDSKNE